MNPLAPVIAIVFVIKHIPTTQSGAPQLYTQYERPQVKIAFLSQYFFPEQFSNNEIAKWLVAQGHEVDVVCCVPNYPAGVFFDGYSNRSRRFEIWEGIRIHRAWTKARGHGSLSLLANFLTYPIAAARTLARKVRGGSDVSFVSMPSPLFQALAGIYLKYRFGVPTVYWVQDIWPESALLTLNLRNPIVVRPLEWICGWIYRRADLVLVQSEAFPPMIERFGVSPAKIRVFPNTAPDTYRPISPDRNSKAGQMLAAVPSDSFRIFFAGNIGESQDFDTYIAAAERLKAEGRAVSWVIIGSGRDMERVQNEIARRDLNDVFHFLGRHPEEDMPLFFAHADAMLVGLKDNNIFSLTVPYKVQCYMACAKPIIGSLNGEGARIINAAQAGLTAKAETPEALARQIAAMMDISPQARHQMGAAGLQYFKENYAKDIIYGNLQRWLKEIASA